MDLDIALSLSRRRPSTPAMIADHHHRESPFLASKSAILSMTWTKILAICLIALPLLVALRLALPYSSFDRAVGFADARIVGKTSHNNATAVARGKHTLLRFSTLCD